MKIPDNAQVFDSPLLVFWFDENGILCSNSKPVPHTLSTMKETAEMIKKILKGKKVCTVADNTNSQPINKEIRDYLGKELPNIYKAIASISNSVLGKTIVNFYFKLKPPPFPTRIFNTEKEAKEWIKQYL